MPKPKIDSLYSVWPSRLNTNLSNAGTDKIPVRVLSATEWTIPKYRGDLQPHRAESSAKFAGLHPIHDRDMSVCFGILVCWAEENYRHAATGGEAVQRLRALARWDRRRRFDDYRNGDLKTARMQVDVVFADDLTALIAEEG